MKSLHRRLIIASLQDSINKNKTALENCRKRKNPALSEHEKKLERRIFDYSQAMSEFIANYE